VAGNVTVTGSMTYGPSDGSSPLMTVPVSYVSAFANTLSTLTTSPSGTPVTVSAMYGPVVGGVAQSYFTSGAVTEGSMQCVETAQGQRQ
jgi:hypothetical protein